jgi:hypothetical protein
MAANPVSVVNSYTDWFSREPGMTKAATGLRRTLGFGALLFFVVAMSGNASAQAGDAERILKRAREIFSERVQDEPVRLVVEAVVAVAPVETR